MRAVRSYRTVSPLPRGGLFSVALSLGLPPPEVIRHRVSVEPGLSSTAKAAAIRPAGPSHIGALGHFVNYQISNSRVVQMPHDDKFPDPRLDFPLDPEHRLGCLKELGIGAGNARKKHAEDFPFDVTDHLVDRACGLRLYA